MRPVLVLVVGVAVFWLHVTVGPQISIFGYKPSLLLIVVVVIGLRWVHPWVFVFAAVAGLVQDVFSHGELGVNGISYLVAGVLANLAGKLVFEHNMFFISLVVGAITIVEGLVSLIAIDIVSGDVAWLSWFFGRVLPQAVYHAILAPVFVLVLNLLQRRYPV